MSGIASGRRSLVARGGFGAAAFLLRQGFPWVAAVSHGTARGTGAAPGEASRTLRVGPSRTIRRIAQAAATARDGDVVEIDAGTYPGDVATWPQRRLTIRAVGGAVNVPANGRDAEGKAIWVITDGDFDVEGIELSGARVRDRNGAGIRLSAGRLRIANCRFVDNEMGVLTGNDASSELHVDACYFEGPTNRPAGPGLSHNLYAGTIGRFTITRSRSVRAQEGHLLKCRAAESRIVGNAFVDGPGGTASYELDLPNGGVALVRGNLVVQETATENPVVVTFGEEGYRWPRNELVLERNTVVNRLPGGVFVRVSPGAQLAVARSNLWVGAGTFEGIDAGPSGGNASADLESLAGPEIGDYRPVASAKGRFDPRAVGACDAGACPPRREVGGR